MAHKSLKKHKLLEFEYSASNEIRKQVIRSENTKLKRLVKWLHHLILFPFKWLWYNIRDVSTFVIFVVVFLCLSSIVWLPYVLSFIFKGTPFGISMFAFGSTAWAIILGPGTPFMVVCIGITIGVKTIFNKIKQRRLIKNGKI